MNEQELDAIFYFAANAYFTSTLQYKEHTYTKAFHSFSAFMGGMFLTTTAGGMGSYFINKQPTKHVLTFLIIGQVFTSGVVSISTLHINTNKQKDLMESANNWKAFSQVCNLALITRQGSLAELTQQYNNCTAKSVTGSNILYWALNRTGGFNAYKRVKRQTGYLPKELQVKPEFIEYMAT